MIEDIDRILEESIAQYEKGRELKKFFSEEQASFIDSKGGRITHDEFTDFFIEFSCRHGLLTLKGETKEDINKFKTDITRMTLDAISR